jgi:two-component system cell cycle response regulator CpdR
MVTGSYSRPHLRILLVEDDADSSRGLAKLLEFAGFVVTIAPTGEDALRILAREPSPDFLLTDVQLPDLDGRDLARQARLAVPGLRIALITGWDLPSEEEDLKAMGVDGVLLKPIPIRALTDWIKGQTRG